SPATWYAKKGWAMSPGYDLEQHSGFQRPVGEACLFCHAGRFETVGGSPNRIAFQEMAISCERCHGPGALHVERHGPQAKLPDLGQQPDHTIVNPAHLSRSLAEAICQDCHLSGSASILMRGRKFDDF